MKDKKIKIIIRFIVSKYDDILINSLIKRLNQIAQEYSPDMNIVLDSAEPYWKYPEETDCIFAVSTSQDITVEKFIKIFDIDWYEYTATPSYNVEDPQQKTVISESAIWSSTCTKNIFWDKKVLWVHVYNWDSF